MELDDYRYSTEVKGKGEWQWMSGGNDLNNEKRHLRKLVDQNPGLIGRVIDKTTGEAVFIDPDPDALKIRFRENEDDDWRSLELIYVDEEGKWLNVRDGSMMGIWLSVEQVHPDDQKAVLEFGRKMERRNYTSEEVNKWARFYSQLHQLAERTRKKAAQEKENTDSEAG